MLNNSKQWIFLEMEAGYPIIGKTMSQKFLPQSVNLDKLKAISFNKGCYYGQETIARVFYKNLNKKVFWQIFISLILLIKFNKIKKESNPS